MEAQRLTDDGNRFQGLAGRDTRLAVRFLCALDQIQSSVDGQLRGTHLTRLISRLAIRPRWSRSTARFALFSNKGDGRARGDAQKGELTKSPASSRTPLSEDVAGKIL
jgi:hypothetical protein